MYNCRYQDVIVFIVGGGCYSEYYNLQVRKEKRRGAMRGWGWRCSLVNIIVLCDLRLSPAWWYSSAFLLHNMSNNTDNSSESPPQLPPLFPFLDIQDLLKQKQSGGGGALRNIIYGCSELLSGDDFLTQLERLGATSAAKWCHLDSHTKNSEMC